MNIPPLTIYIWQLADKLSEVSFTLSLISGFFTAGALLACVATRVEDMEDELKSITSKAAAVTMTLLTLFTASYTFIPSSSTVAMMVIIPEIANSKALQKDVPDIYNAAVDALKKQLAKEAEKP